MGGTCVRGRRDLSGTGGRDCNGREERRESRGSGVKVDSLET